MGLLHNLFASFTRHRAAERNYDGPWTGRWILPKRGGIQIGTADPQTREIRYFGALKWTCYYVCGDQDGWLWVQQDEGAGFILKDESVPVEAGEQYFSEVLRANPNDVHAYTCRGNTWHRRGNLNRAISDYSAALERDPEATAALMMRGLAWGEKNEYDHAIQDFDAVIRLRPGEAVAWVNRGHAYFARRAFRRAITDYDEAIRLSPRLYIAYINRGAAWDSLKEYDRALADFEAAIALNPDDATGNYNRGRTWSNRGEFAKALDDCNEALRRSPQLVEAFAVRGNARAYQREFETALRDFDEALRLNPQSAHALLGRGLVRAAQKQYDRAHQDSTEAHRLQPDLPIPLGGWRCLLTNDYAGALREFDETLQVNPEDAPSLAGKAWVLATCPEPRFRDGNEAMALARRACESTGWQDAGPLHSLAAACAEAGRFDEAVRWQRQAMDDPAFTQFLIYGQEAQNQLQLYCNRRPYRTEQIKPAANES
jgi:tetratricopeptide (TPR) repeat protein